MDATIAPTRIVLNGCSYMDSYYAGGGLHDLAQTLGISEYKSLAVSGSSNDQIIRTTFKDSLNQDPTLYVIGITFIGRMELSLSSDSEPWTSAKLVPNGVHINSKNLSPQISKSDVKQYIELNQKFAITALDSHLELLFFRLIMLIDSLKSRGHRVIIFNTAEESIIGAPIIDVFTGYPEVIRKFQWLAVPYQFKSGADSDPADNSIEEKFRHVKKGDHKHLNYFLVNYLRLYDV